MKKNIKFLLLVLLTFMLPDIVFATTKLQCSYNGSIPSYDEDLEILVTIKLDGKVGEGENAVFSSTVQVIDSNYTSLDIESCKSGKNFNQCLLDIWTKANGGNATAAQEYINANNLKITFGDNYSDIGNDMVNILTTNSNGKYQLLKENKQDYFVKNGKYTCPDSLVVLSRLSLNNENHNYSFYIDKDGFNTSKCDNGMIGNYLCAYSSTFRKNSNYTTIEMDYDGGIISSGYCCVYRNENNVNPVYVYSYDNGTGNKNYSVCYGLNCMTTSPLPNHIINGSEWSSYHNLGDCSSMPEKIWFKYGETVYEKKLDSTLTCKAPTNSTPNVNNLYKDAIFYYSKDLANANNSSDIDFGDPVEVNCEGILGDELIDFLNKIFRWIQILAPIFVIIISGIDFAGAILQDDKDAMKKASSKFIKRLIIAIALFFIPLILSWLLNIFNDISGAASSTCGIGE